MEQYDARIDAVIDKAADFAKPILIHLRKVVRKASPLLTENIKWGMPFFEYKGPVCMMAAFKKHCAFGFWKAAALDDPNHLLQSGGESSAGSFGKITSIADLPSEAILKEFILQAIKLNESGEKVGVRKNPPKPASEKKPLETPDYLIVLLNEHPKAKETFEKFSPSHRKEYIEWIVEAKTDATRQKRLETTIEWLIEGKSRMWKYK